MPLTLVKTNKQPSFDKTAEIIKEQLIAGEIVLMNDYLHSFFDVLNMACGNLKHLTHIEDGIKKISEGQFIEGAELIHKTMVGDAKNTGAFGEYVDSVMGKESIQE